MSRMCFVLAVAAAVSSAASAGVFTLDDNPVAPIVPPPYPAVGMGAEDPFGLGLVPAPGLAPSPSLGAIPAIDGDILMPGPGPLPVVNLPTLDGWSTNAISTSKKIRDLDLHFSVDRLALGAPGSAVAGEAVLFQQPGDLYMATTIFPSPGAFCGTLGPGPFAGVLPTAGVGGSNVLVIDESQLDLTAVGAPGTLTPPGVMTPPPLPGVRMKDNVDGYDGPQYDVDGDGLNDVWAYLSVNPDEAAMGVSAADIFDVAPQGGTVIPFPYASSFSMGLDSLGMNTDDIDALIIWDMNLPGSMIWGGPGAEPGIDFALFSLAPGSRSLNAFNLSAADILFTDFTGAFAVFAFAGDIGLLPTDNVDALVPEPATLSLLVLGGLVLMSRRKRNH